MFTNVSIEYIPLLSLAHNPSGNPQYDGFWFAPNASGVYSEPFFISSVRDDNNFYGTFIHPDLPVNYTMGYCDANGDGKEDIYVVFDETPGSNPKAAIYYSKANGTYIKQFALKDDLLFSHDLIKSPSDLIGGTFDLTLKLGFNNVLYSE